MINREYTQVAKVTVAVVVIPARYGSTRFPGKPLALLKGKPIIHWVYERAKDSRLAQDVIVATDDERIFRSIVEIGGKAVMTEPHHASGTDRIAEVARSLESDIIINVQGDEPFIKGDMIDHTIELLKDPRASISTLARRIESPEELIDPNVVKVVFDSEGFALYFSRSVIPYYRDRWKAPTVTCATDTSLFIENEIEIYKHIGIYGYRRDALLMLSRSPQSRLEKIEKLEQLRALEKGLKIKVGLTPYNTIGIDTPEDLKKAEELISKRE